jgi:hypothetical protein
VTYEQIKKASDRVKETNDCSVMALALVLGVSYETVHLALDAAGRKYRGGTPLYVTEKAVKALGFRVARYYSAERLGLEVGVRRPKTGDAAKNPDAWAHLPNLYLRVPDHAAALLRGKVEDWTVDRDAPILEALEIVPERAELARGQKPPPVIYLGARL